MNPLSILHIESTVDNEIAEPIQSPLPLNREGLSPGNLVTIRSVLVIDASSSMNTDHICIHAQIDVAV